MCGIFAVTQSESAAALVYLGLFALQHRGQESCGIASMDGTKVHTYRKYGLVSDVFTSDVIGTLKGKASIGHVLYPTAGTPNASNIQPLDANIHGVNVSLAHNGNFANASTLRDELCQQGALFRGSADTEILLHLIAKQDHRLDFLSKLTLSLARIQGAYSLLILTSTHLYAVVDPSGYRPLVLGRLDSKNWVVASETCALDLVDAQFLRDLQPGEILSVELESGSQTSHKILSGTMSRCSFEHIYFARPDSQLWGSNVLAMRESLGVQLAIEAPCPTGEVTIAVPDSGIPMAAGYARKSGIPCVTGFIRNHYVGRTFIETSQVIRNLKVRMKLNPIRDSVRGKSVVVLDDSIVRGTTSQKIIELLREAGAREVHMRIGAPPVKHPCYYGIDTPRRSDLLGHKHSVEEMRKILGADSLRFLSESGLALALKVPGWCTSCFSGKYQDAAAKMLALEEK